MDGLMTKETREAVSLENRGEKIFGVLHLPDGRLDVPCVIILHGFASNKMGTLNSHVKIAKRLVKEEIACLRFDFRGAGDSEGDLEKMTMEEFVSDVKVVYQFLKEKGFESIGIYGSSFGGSVAILSAAELDVRSLCLWAPLASGLLWYQDWMEKNTKGIEKYRGIEITDNFKRDFALLHADKVLEKLENIPVLHMQGVNDEVVSLRHKTAFENARKNAKAQSKFLLFSEAEHQLGKSKDFSKVADGIVEWFRTTMR